MQAASAKTRRREGSREEETYLDFLRGCLRVFALAV
jgi:hypothetical protein